MGFFSGVSKIAGGLSGMAGGEKVSQSVPASGYYSMPPEYQELFKQLSTNASSTLFPGGQINSQMFTPLAQTAGETRGLQMINQGMAPTEESLRRDIGMQMNPFDDFVINDINQQSQGANSLVNQNATMMGQQGSNRQFLGSSDVEQNRLNSIGQFRQGQYNTAVNNALGPLANLKQQDIANLFTGGEFERGLHAQTQQAPYSALSAAGGILGGMPTNFGNQYQGGTASSGSSTGSTLGKIAQGAQLAATVAGFFSDKRLKENIEYAGEENGFPIYEFNYLGDETRFIGVLADDVQNIMPEAVYESEGYKKVDYDMIGVEVRMID